MPDKVEHSPLPWHRAKHGITMIVAADRARVADCQVAIGTDSAEAEANARFIVRAVNSHEARERLLNASLDLLSDVYDSRASQRFSAIGLSRIKSHIADLRAALAEKESD